MHKSWISLSGSSKSEHESSPYFNSKGWCTFLEKLRVLIADRNISDRKQIAEAVERAEFGKVERVTSNGTIAIEWLGQSCVDVIILDVGILKAEGMDILRTIQREYRDVEIIIAGTPDPGDATVTLEALKLGALDFILKLPGAGEENNIQTIKSHLQMLFVQIKIKKYSFSPNGTARQVAEKKAGKEDKAADKHAIYKNTVNDEKKEWTGADLVVIASSTGGPNALETVLCGLPSFFSTPILIVQHMPPNFTDILARALDKKCNIRVHEAQDLEAIQKGKILIAPGGLHLTVDLDDNYGRLVRLENTPFVHGVRPSADVLFHTVAKAYEGRNILAVILTGMGNDGASGVAEIKKNCNCYCITQSEKTCVVYGMPRNVLEAGLSDEVADIGMIAQRIVQISLSGDKGK